MLKAEIGVPAPRPAHKRIEEIGSYFDGWRAGYRGHPMKAPPTVVLADWLAGYSDGKALRDVRCRLRSQQVVN